MLAETAKKREGAAAENRAAAFLERAGLSLIARNYRSPFGEIDLIMQQAETLVFVEVRFRARSDYGTPAETVDNRKQSRLRATAEHFLQSDRRASKRPCRFDIVAVTASAEGDRVEWLRNAF
jgi:putative endonuclease